MPHERAGRCAVQRPPRVVQRSPAQRSQAQPQQLFDDGNEPQTRDGQRQIAAIALPQFLLEIHQRGESDRSSQPTAIVVLEQDEKGKPNDLLHAVCPRAEKLGVSRGQSIAQASALLAGLRIETVQRHEVQQCLTAVAEVVRNLGVIVSVDSDHEDTVWLDVTGVGHLFGGAEALALEIHERVRLLGHLNRVVLAPGPRIARALAHFGPITRRGVRVVESSDVVSSLEPLPLLALGIEPKLLTWLARLGLFSVGDLRKLPPAAASSRLEKQALRVLELAHGRDTTPLVPCEFPRSLEQSIEWEEPSEGLSPLLFALRGLISKVSARLQGRGEAATQLELTLIYDRATARHRKVLRRVQLDFSLSSPLFREGDLERVLRSRLERTQLQAPTVGIVLCAKELTAQAMHQLELGQGSALNLTELPILLAELQADLGPDRMGLLDLRDGHLPEARTALVPIDERVPLASGPAFSLGTTRRSRRKRGTTRSFAWSRTPLDRATRLLPRPVPIITALAVGSGFLFQEVFYTIKRLQFVQRLESVHWWMPQSTSRDYLWVWLSSLEGDAEALIFVDRRDGRRFLQALAD